MGERIAVLVSGNGTNLQALLDDAFCGPRISLVLADRPAIRALERADAVGVETLVIEPSGYPDRDAFDEAVTSALVRHGADVVVTAGYMRLLGRAVLDVFDGRWLNTHPSLLPSFPGMHGVRDALAHGVKVTGVSVFLVDEGMDTGPIVLQEAVDVRADDDWHSLEGRILEVEHRLLPRAVRALVEGRVHVEGRHVTITEGNR
ncbi:MAG: phosphoribosylglycinamide formyltransferase [Actinomycetota bacterium]|nr:phosphoribosylglycinamide formyltransferase [Actinomycetota bacterium]MDH5223509.1 phosphoribosylglycinamide formyltransferase [Actinomycetota bacterium]MDH5313352.1 phosphoribosylglycinamide formyltransferase [Actinomycetota bacterium]